MFNVECGPELVALIQHSTFHIQHSTFAFQARLGSERRAANRQKNKTAGFQTAAPSQPDVGQGVPTRESAAISKPAKPDNRHCRWSLGQPALRAVPAGRQRATPPSPVCRPGEPTREDAAVSRPECTQRVDGKIAFGMNALREPAGLRARRRARIRRDRDQDQRGRGDHMLHARERDQRDG